MRHIAAGIGGGLLGSVLVMVITGQSWEDVAEVTAVALPLAILTALVTLHIAKRKGKGRREPLE